jgi:hypothetical protein
MGVRILHDREQNYAALYCSTTDVVFGPLFNDSDDHEHDAEERAHAFLRWLPKDARQYDDVELAAKYSDWRAQEATQWQAEKDADDAKGVVDDEIEELRAVAQKDGDMAEVKTCDLALAGDVAARAKCCRRILKRYIATMKVMEG